MIAWTHALNHEAIPLARSVTVDMITEISDCTCSSLGHITM